MINMIPLSFNACFALIIYLHISEMSERPQPLKAINTFFDGKEPWQIVTMTASSVLALVWAHSLYNAKESK